MSPPSEKEITGCHNTSVFSDGLVQSDMEIGTPRDSETFQGQLGPKTGLEPRPSAF